MENKIDRRIKLVEVFKDTQKFYAADPVLAAAITYGRQNTRLYNEDEYPEIPESQYGRQGIVCVTKSRTFEAAMRLQKENPGKKIGVLNFASATNPGGGVKGGSSAQEESLCRCSTLFPTIDRKWLFKEYYSVNREAANIRYNDACIYSPAVLICKTDEDYPKRMEQDEFVSVDVITCAAPNLRWCADDFDDDELYEIHVQRAKHILHVAAANGLDILVLGAFGCGAFKNDPAIVASAYREVLDGRRFWFDLVEFAIYCREFETDNYRTFYDKLRDL